MQFDITINNFMSRLLLHRVHYITGLISNITIYVLLVFKDYSPCESGIQYSTIAQIIQMSS